MCRLESPVAITVANINSQVPVWKANGPGDWDAEGNRAADDHFHRRPRKLRRRRSKPPIVNLLTPR